MGVLEKLNTYGMEKIEDAVLAGLVTGDPVLLIGSHGSAKTLLARRLAGSLRLRFHAYDASKAMFEDVIGFPNPDSLSKGIVEYTPTSISIWGKEFVLVDELSRASPAMQNKWLEVIRSRQIMGKQIEGLQYIFAAMNPPGYLGSMPLDEALAGRFAFVIRVPEARDMSAEDIGKIIEHVSEDDAPVLPHLDRKGNGTSLNSLVRNVQERFPILEKKYGKVLRDYVTHLSSAFKMNRHPLDGRRLGMIHRNLLAYLAVRQEKGGTAEISPEALDGFCFDCLGFSLPFDASGTKLSDQIRFNSHRTAAKLLWEKDGGKDKRLRVFLAGGPLDMLREFEKVGNEISGNEHQDLVSYLEELMATSKDPAELAQGFLALQRVARAYQGGKIQADADTMRRVMQIYLKLTSLAGTDNQISEFISYQGVFGTSIKFNLSDRIDSLALRLAIRLSPEDGGSPRFRRRAPSTDQVKELANLFESLRFELRRYSDEDNRIETS